MSNTSPATSVPPSATQNAATGNVFYNVPGATGLTNSTGGVQGAATTSANGGPISPGQAFSPYQLQSTVYPEQVNLGSFASILGAPSGTVSIGTAMQEFNDLSVSQLVYLEEALWQAGFYVDSEGNPLKTAPVLGTRDNQAFDAFVNALSTAANSKTPVDQVIQNAIQSGVGANNRSTLPTAVLGGGHTYQIDLSNPQDVQYTANQVFQAALGRNATTTEVAAITGALQSSEKAQGLSQETSQEQSSRAQYQAQVNQRNIQYQYTTTPKSALGPVPNGPFNDNAEWAVAELQYMSLPVTNSNVAFLTGWANREGGGGQNNPLNTTLAQPGSTVLPGNSAGVQNYQSAAQGIQATAQTLQNYPNIMSALISGNASQAQNKGTAADLSKWSGGGYSSITPSGNDVNAANQALSQPQANSANLSPQQEAQSNAAAERGGGGAPFSAQSMQQNPPSPQEQQFLQYLSQGAPGANPQQVAQLEQANPNWSPTGTPAYDVTQGQTTPNPGDQYINPVTSITVNPATEAAAAYNEATTGPNRIPYGGYQYLQAYNAVLSMVKNGGISGG